MTPNRQVPVVLLFRSAGVGGGTLKGFCDIQHPSGLVMRNIAVHRAGSREWCSPPSVDIDFANHGVQRRWSETVLAELRRTNPEIFTTELTL